MATKFIEQLMKYRRPIGIILVLVGLGFLAIRPYQQHMMKSLDNEVKTELKSITPESVKEADENTDASYDYSAVSAVSLDSILAAKNSEAKVPMIGEIAIPDIGLNLPIVKGVTNENLLYGAATMKPNQKMGVGNYSLASHYSDAYDETLLFAPLIRSQAGMKIYITDMEKIYTYTITSVTLVDPSAVEVLDETGENIITLVTCNDLSATMRRIVRGKLTNITNVNNASEDVKNAFQAEFKTY